jgi:hypothetical protein
LELASSSGGSDSRSFFEADGNYSRDGHSSTRVVVSPNARRLDEEETPFTYGEAEFTEFTELTRFKAWTTFRKGETITYTDAAIKADATLISIEDPGVSTKRENAFVVNTSQIDLGPTFGRGPMLAAIHPLAILAAMAHTTIYLVCEFDSFPSAATLRTGTGCDVDYTFIHMKNIGKNICSGSPTATPLSAITDTLPGFSGRSLPFDQDLPSLDLTIAQQSDKRVSKIEYNSIFLPRDLSHANQNGIHLRVSSINLLNYAKLYDLACFIPKLRYGYCPEWLLTGWEIIGFINPFHWKSLSLAAMDAEGLDACFIQVKMPTRSAEQRAADRASLGKGSGMIKAVGNQYILFSGFGKTHSL